MEIIAWFRVGGQSNFRARPRDGFATFIEVSMLRELWVSTGMMFLLLMKAMLLGAVNAAPVGPVGLLCLKKNVDPDRWSGLCAAFGMALAYAIVAFCVVFGLKTVGQFLDNHRTFLQLAGGLALVALGWHGLRSKRVAVVEKRKATRYLGDLSASFAMTLFNPVPFATFAVIVTSFNILDSKLDIPTDIAFAAAVAAGTMAFWLVVNQILHFAKRRSRVDLCRWISRGAAVAMIGFGVVLAITGIV